MIELWHAYHGQFWNSLGYLVLQIIGPLVAFYIASRSYFKQKEASEKEKLEQRLDLQRIYQERMLDALNNLYSKSNKVLQVRDTIVKIFRNSMAKEEISMINGIFQDFYTTFINNKIYLPKSVRTEVEEFIRATGDLQFLFFTAELSSRREGTVNQGTLNDIGKIIADKLPQLHRNLENEIIRLITPQ